MLEQLLASLPAVPDPEGRVLLGFAHNEDAVIVRTPPAGQALVQTVDVLTPIGNNPRLFGQVAAANALSDVYAMGGEPWCAMNVVGFPSSCWPLDMLREILVGGVEKLIESGAVLAGGHTLEDGEIKYGLAVTGVIDPAAAASNAGLKPGDVLVLTKPLGTGVLATAVKAEWPGAEAFEAELYRWATHLNRHGGEVIRAMRLAAATDVTGFGLGGHLLEMAAASGVRVALDVQALPFMTGVLDLADEGLIPAGTYANREHCVAQTRVASTANELRATLAFDAQTSGGLVLAVPPHRVNEALQRLADLNEPAYLIGHVEQPDNSAGRLVLR